MKFFNEQYYIGDSNYRVIGCSVMGDGKIENQDSFLIYHDEKQIIVVLADGLGSAVYSKEGSSKIVKIASNILSRDMNQDDIPLAILKEWKQSVVGNLNLYDTTLKFVKIKADEIFFGGIGDGWIAINKRKEFINLCANNTFLNQTESILSFGLKEKFIIHKTSTNQFLNLLISTDGFSEDMDKDNGDKFLNEVYKQVLINDKLFESDLQNTLINWPVESNKDDKTIIFVQKISEV